MSNQPQFSDTRLIERWLPIAEIGEESVRERRSMTALPPTYYLHVWWARRPLVASRAAIVASLLPADANHEQFKHILGIHGDPVKVRSQIDSARKTGADLGSNPYGYDRAFKYLPSSEDNEWLKSELTRAATSNANFLDPTAGGGSIPFEAVRLGIATAANDLNPVAATLLYATVEYPTRIGMPLLQAFDRLRSRFLVRILSKLQNIYPTEPDGTSVHAYIWARTITCPYCEGRVPLSPNWRLASDGTGVRVAPLCAGPGTQGRRCDFTIVGKLPEHSAGTVADGDATCPFPDCGRVIDGDAVKRQAQAGQMGEQLYAVAFKRRATVKTKTGKNTVKWERGFRAPRPEDDNGATIALRLAEQLPKWEAMDLVPTEAISELSNYDRGHRMYGMTHWCDMFSPRQLFVHVAAVEVFRELLDEDRHRFDHVSRAAYVYLALSLDKLRDYNSRMSVWHAKREVITNTFSTHNFSTKWSYAEMPLAIAGAGFEWALHQTSKCLGELIELVRPHEARAGGDGELQFASGTWVPPPITLSCKPGDALDHLSDGSVDCVVMDPPYYDNVMYAELSDFFYVWLKRTAGQVLPELFRRLLTDKENEAIANPAKFRDHKHAKARAGRDYQERMAAIFAECRRVLKPNGIMTLMFTHKATGAWDALTKGLMEAGFTITASWPINTEAEGSMHIKDKAAANSTIFLACRPRTTAPSDSETRYWEDVEPLVSQAVRDRVAAFQEGGIRGVDLYLASFGPALQKFSELWPLKRGTPKPLPPLRRKAQKELWEEEWDPYAVSPEDALDAARREVKRWRLEQLTHRRARAELDARTS